MKFYVYADVTLNNIIRITEFFNKDESFLLENDCYITVKIQNINSFYFKVFYSLRKLSDKEREILRKKYVCF